MSKTAAIIITVYATSIWIHYLFFHWIGRADLFCLFPDLDLAAVHVIVVYEGGNLRIVALSASLELLWS
jgi:hypothetical protein